MKPGDIVYPTQESIEKKRNPLSPHKYKILHPIGDDYFMVRDLETGNMFGCYADELIVLESK